MTTKKRKPNGADLLKMANSFRTAVLVQDHVGPCTWAFTGHARGWILNRDDVVKLAEMLEAGSEAMARPKLTTREMLARDVLQFTTEGAIQRKEKAK